VTVSPLPVTLSGGSNLVGNDALSGSLTRDPGEAAGAYTIRQNTLTAGANYALTFVNSVLLIAATTPCKAARRRRSACPTAGRAAAASPPPRGCCLCRR
jgi:hypothetical protein